MAPKKQQPQQHKYSIVLPTYNEKDNIPLVFWLLHDTLIKANIDFEVVVVDDNSPDGTQDVVRRLQKSYGSDCLKLVTRCECVCGGINAMHTLGMYVYMWHTQHRIRTNPASLSIPSPGLASWVWAQPTWQA